jgi:glycosyltransferase involved in cell wall biosynthesis
MNVLRRIDRSAYEFNFVVHTTGVGSYDEEIRALGGEIYACPRPSEWIGYTRRLGRILKEHGPFDVVHSHVYLYSGMIMRIAAKAGVPIRLAHSHTTRKESPFDLRRIPYAFLMKHFLAKYATQRLAVSTAAARALYGNSLGTTCAIVPCAVDFARFARYEDPESSKLRLGIPPGHKVIGHVGRFNRVKNHIFLLDVFEAVLRSRSDVHLLLVGEGPLFARIRSELERRNISALCTLTGAQADVAPFVQAMDVFVFPSLLEGLGLSLLEAQAAGRRILTSSIVPREVDVVPHLINRRGLSEGSKAWAATILDLLEETRPVSDEVFALQNSRFALATCIEALETLYTGPADLQAGRVGQHSEALA